MYTQWTVNMGHPVTRYGIVVVGLLFLRGETGVHVCIHPPTHLASITYFVFILDK